MRDAASAPAVSDTNAETLEGSEWVRVLQGDDVPQPANNRPVFNALSPQTVIIGQTLAFIATANDPDAGDTLRYSLASDARSGMAIDPGTGRFTWTPASTLPVGTVIVTIQATDDGEPNLTATRTVSITVLAPTRTLSIVDATVIEGNRGRRRMIFTVRLSAASSQPITVHYATGNGTALAGLDYRSVSGTLRFRPGQTERTLSVYVVGDRKPEATEQFLVRLSNPVGAFLGDGEAVATVQDNDARSGGHVGAAQQGLRRSY